MKKLVCFICVVLLIFGSFGVSYASEDALQSGDMMFLKALGLVDSDKEESAPLTRIELARIYYNIMAGSENQPPASQSDKFADVSGTDAAVADFVAACGIMNGYGNGAFLPENNVSYIQLIKTVVSFLGYDVAAIQNGGYPSGYYLVGSQLGLCHEPPYDYNAELTFAKAATVLKLAADCDILTDVSFDGTYRKENVSWLERYCRVYRYDAIVYANYLTNIANETKMKYNQVTVGNEVFTIGENAGSIRNMLGFGVDVYYRTNTGGKKEICYFDVISGESIAIEGINIISQSDGRLEYEDSEKKVKTLTLDKNAIVVYNGTVLKNYTTAVFDVYRSQNLDGYVTFIYNNGDSKADIVCIDAYESYVVSMVADNVIYNEYTPGKTVDISRYEDGEILIESILGENIKPSDIEKGDIINVSRDASGVCKKITVTIDTYVGVLNSVESGENTKLTIDGAVYTMSRSLGAVCDLSKLVCGNKIKVYFNKDARICGIETDDYDTYDIGYLVGVKKENLEDVYTLKIFTSNGSFSEFKTADKIALENTGTKLKPEVLFDVTNPSNPGLISYTSGGDVVRAPIYYKTLPGSGLISRMCLYDPSAVRPRNCMPDTYVKDNCIYMHEGFDGISAHGLYYRSSTMSFGAKLLFGGSTVIFYVPTEENRFDDSGYYVEDTSFFGDNSTVKFEAYGSNAESPLIEVGVIKAGRWVLGSEIGFNSNVMVIGDISRVIDEDTGDEMYAVSGCHYGSNVKYLTREDAVSYVQTAPEKRLGKGDIIMFNPDNNGKIRNIDVLFRAANKSFEFNSNPSDASYSASKRFAYGKVIYKDDNFLTVAIPKSDGTYTTESFPLASFRFVECKGLGDRMTVSLAGADKIFDEKNFGDNASYVFVHTRIGDGRTIVIYNK